MARIARSFTDAGLARYVANMDPAMLALARRHDPRAHKDYWGRVQGWERIDIKKIPRLGDITPDFDEARIINALKPVAPDPVEAARPFVLKANTADGAKALRCLTQAVYFESAFEPLSGQQAVAQTVLNRLRHGGYPKSVCGVIYEGAARATGCQFSFTCDGSLARVPNPTLWASAEFVARKALSGFVMKDVGVATHYHASYVAPYWAPTLVKLKQVGQHIFYPAGRRRPHAGSRARRGPGGRGGGQYRGPGPGSGGRLDPHDPGPRRAVDGDPGSQRAQRGAPEIRRRHRRPPHPDARRDRRDQQGARQAARGGRRPG